ncbi:hypothetical protein HK104_010467 [Borealophlyctis nickersoniae]|nr:hypothetical protein HK104_010467 [Borealophlyctis nickersoniae]
MKHGTRFWQKKLGRTPLGREHLLRILCTNLIINEKIQTTFAKAKFMERHVNMMISYAKSKDEKDRQQVRDFFNMNQDKVLPKLFGPLAARYAERRWGYTRIMRAGFAPISKGRYPVAIVELVDRPDEIVHSMARLHIDKFREALDAVRGKLYNVEKIALKDPVTREDVVMTRYSNRDDVLHSKRGLRRAERHFSNVVHKYEKSLVSWPKARESDAKFADVLKQCAPKVGLSREHKNSLRGWQKIHIRPPTRPPVEEEQFHPMVRALPTFGKMGFAGGPKKWKVYAAYKERLKKKQEAWAEKAKNVKWGNGWRF